MLLLFCFVNSCEKSGPASTLNITVSGSDTLLEVRGASPDAMSAVGKAIREFLVRQQAQSHAWKASELTQTNAALAKGMPGALSKNNLALLEISRPLYVASNGYYDPSIGSLVRMWGFYTDSFPITQKPPTQRQISEWLANKPDFPEVRVHSHKVISANPTTQLDFSTILEGAAAREIKRIFSEQKIRDARVTMGSDTFLIGDGSSKPWNTSLKDPFGGDLGQIQMQGNEALFSSGNFNRFRMAPSGSRWGHILNPRTGKPSQGSAAVVVLHSDAILADAGSTALMAGGPGNFENLVRRMKLACAMMVTEENELLVTAQMKKRVVFFRDPVPLGKPIANGTRCG